jgi:hypothetical protein
LRREVTTNREEAPVAAENTITENTIKTTDGVVDLDALLADEVVTKPARKPRAKPAPTAGSHESIVAAREDAERAREAAKKETAAPKSRRSSYPVEVTEAVKLAKEARGTTHGAPGAKQHVAVRAEVGEKSTPAEILKAAGVRSEKQLRAIADGSSSKEDLALLKPLAAKFEDPFCKGRNLASMLVAMVAQAKK